MKKFRAVILMTIIMLGCLGCTADGEASVVPGTAISTEPAINLTATPLSAASTLSPTATPYNKIPEQVGDGWQTSSVVEAGIDPVWIDKMLASIYRGVGQGDTLTMPSGLQKIVNIHGILIVKDGLLVFEEYFYRYHLARGHDLASVTKSITSLLVGLAIDQGVIGSVKDKVVPYFPEYLPLPGQEAGKDDITIADLLTMRSGLNCSDWDPLSPSYYLNNQPYRPDEIQYILNLPMAAQPSSEFSYCTWGTSILNALLIQQTGMDLPAYAEKNLFQPLGITDVQWDVTSGDWQNIDGIMTMRPRDLAKIGQLMLQNGAWNEEQVIPEDWVVQSATEWVPLLFNTTWGSGYGYLWWISDVPVGRQMVHSFAASGHGGQVIAVFPDLEMVVVITGGNYENDQGQPFDIMERFILPAVLQP